MGQQVGTAVGFVAGFFLPGGPQVWAGIGGIVGGVIKPEVIPGPRLGEIQNQTASEGGPRPIIFGRSQPIAGNILVDSEPRKVQDDPGKGQPKQQEPEQVYRTYAIGICRGSISDILQVWRNGTLVYDIEDPGMSADNELFLETARFYLGTFDQMPSPDLEAIKGVGNVHGYRGTCYMVLADENLTDTRGMWAQWQFRVARFPEAQSGRWWALKLSGGSGLDKLWRSTGTGVAFDDPGETRGPPNVLLGGSNYGTALAKFPDNTMILYGNANQIERYTNYTAEELPAPTIETIYEDAVDLLRIRAFDNCAVAIVNASRYHVWTASGGWQQIDLDSDESIGDVARLENGRWITIKRKTTDNTRYAGYSEQDVPTSWNWTPIEGNPGYNLAAILVVGNVAVSVAQYFEGRASIQTTTGITWQPGTFGEIGNDGKCGSVSPGGTIVFADTNSTSIARSTNGGADFANIETGQYWENVSYGNSIWVLSGDNSVTPQNIQFSTDDALTFGPYEMPEAGQWKVAFADPPFDYRDSFYPLPLIITELSEQVSMTSAMFDVSLLAEYQCRGLTITNTYPVYKILETLSQDFFFMPSNVSGKVKFVPFGADTVATITENDLVYDEDAEFEDDTRISDSLVVPPKLHLNYFDVLGGLNTDKQSSERPRNGRNYSEQSMQTPVTLSADEAATRVAKTHAMMVEQQRGEFRFSLPDSYLRLTESDPVFFQRNSGKTDRIVLTRVDTQDGYQDYTAVRDRQSIHSLQVEGYPPAPVTRPPSRVTGPTVIEVIDGPLWRDADDRLGLFVAVSGVFPAWSGTRVELSIDGGATYIASASTTTAATMGTVTSVMADHPQAYPDTVSTVQVSISTPGAGLETTDLAGMLNLRNLALIGDEYFNFADADEVSPGLWDLSYFLRGRKGTSTEQHEIGERFVLLNGGVIFVPIELAYLNHSLTFRATSFGTSVDDATITTITFTGGTQIEREPGYLSVYPDGTDLVIEWQGVGRLGAGVNARMGVNFSGYFVTVTDGTLTNTYNVAVGTETLTVPFAAYTGPITIFVQQRNQFTGLGPATQVIYANP